MTHVSKRIRPFLDVLENEGCEVIDLAITGSCHYKITVTSNGKKRFFVASLSGSDVRAVKNFRSDVRRWVREIMPSRDPAFASM